MQIPQHIADRISRCVDGSDGPKFAIDEEARSHKAIALAGSIGTIWGLRADGTFWQFDEDSGLAFAPLPTELETQAIVKGRERHPWLFELLPIRPSSASSCAQCNGSGHLGPTWVCAKCNGLGWVGA